MNQGDYIILTIDLNHHVINSNEAAILWNLGLFEVITDKYSDRSLGPTYQRGQVPIDGIYLSGSLTISKGGYFPIIQIPSDHRAL